MDLYELERHLRGLQKAGFPRRLCRNGMSATHDIIFVGGGLANGLAACRLKETRPALKILLLEGADRFGGNHTWSFHQHDLSPADRTWISPFLSQSWPAYQVFFPQ